MSILSRFGRTGVPRIRSRTEPPFERLGWAGTALAGAVVGHVLTYLAAFVNPSTRQAVLDETGHFYWSFAVPVAAAVGFLSIGLLVVRRLRSTGKPGTPIEGIFRTASRLSLLQLAIFACFEVGERLLSGAPLGAFLGDTLLPLALVIQPFVAIGVVFLLRGLAKAAEIVARVFRSPPYSRSIRAWPLPATPPRPSLLPLSGAWGLRGPPSS